ncbi:hypothetical protein Daura_19640 [Dactylosporangium aurantiacum]|uniref:Uncharacterized protein n=1 Tax=Dactylosporangium aurantiacum TaxID=35754 RepID=A0A9Q9IRR3_9ACTN|nr:hypothetical protein [Dactylosporangium aurantiacum]MDG6106323.1 hypothetical protein [Dactylosporangium aurantiacum]UWZ58185.1 hypothetical protein Daura_19640 [Dactylosporangium aurantiacum]
MSTGAKVMQILFIIAGTLCLGIGLLGSMAEGDGKITAAWTCYPPSQSTPQTCNGSTRDGGKEVPTQFILTGIGLQIAAAACAIGGRRDHGAPPPVPYAVPGQPAFPPRPVMPGSPVAPATGQLPQPGWPS